jgi:hypothetical protein
MNVQHVADVGGAFGRSGEGDSAYAACADGVEGPSRWPATPTCGGSDTGARRSVRFDGVHGVGALGMADDEAQAHAGSDSKAGATEWRRAGAIASGSCVHHSGRMSAIEDARRFPRKTNDAWNVQRRIKAE